MILKFEYGAIDKQPAETESDWFQITYNSIRTAADEDIALYLNGFWEFEGQQYSDIVIIA